MNRPPSGGGPAAVAMGLIQGLYGGKSCGLARGGGARSIFEPSKTKRGAGRGAARAARPQTCEHREPLS